MNDIAARLRLAREAAGFSSIREAVERFGLNYATYAGHENGHRGIRPDVLRSYAHHFKVDPGWLLDGNGDAPIAGIDAIKPATTGFSEPEVKPFQPRSAGHGKIVEQLAASLAPGARHLMIYIAQRDFSPFSILMGDALVIGTPLRPSDGDIVIANLSDGTPHSGITVLRQRMGDQLVPPLHGRIAGEQSMSAGILGTVVAVVRSEILTA